MENGLASRCLALRMVSTVCCYGPVVSKFHFFSTYYYYYSICAIKKWHMD
jgi:hypothetical protein